MLGVDSKCQAGFPLRAKHFSLLTVSGPSVTVRMPKLKGKRFTAAHTSSDRSGARSNAPFLTAHPAIR